MVLFESTQPPVEVPENLTTWEWLFESERYSPLFTQSDKPLRAFVDAETKERLDWAEVKLKSASLSTCLTAQYGLSPGETVSIFASNTIWYPVAMFAVNRIGALTNGASAALTIDEMAYALRVARTKILITLPASLEKALAAAKQVGIPASHVLLLQGQVNGFLSIQDLIRLGSELLPQPAYQVPNGMTNKQLCGYLNFSSGTTGLPKAVMLSHHNIIAQCIIMGQLQVDSDHVKILAVMPLYHITGTWRFCYYPVYMNGDAVMLPSFSLPAMLKAVIEFSIEELVLVPPILLRLARDPIVDQFDLRHVKRWTSGAAPMSPEVLKSLQQRFPWTGFRQGYGATESPCVAAQPPTHWDYKYGMSVGMLVSNTTAKVINTTTGQELGPNEDGEILVKGPQVAMGYLDNQKATAETFDSDGFYHTGDVGSIDEDGLIFIKDRIKEMIKVKGYQVPPAELEDLLLGHEDVSDCAVVSIPDDYAGELPKAYIVLKTYVPVSDETGHRILDYVRQHKVNYKWLIEVEFIDKIPKSPAGKLLRRVLKERAKGSGLETTTGHRVRAEKKIRTQKSLERQIEHNVMIQNPLLSWWFWIIDRPVTVYKRFVSYAFNVIHGSLR